MKNGFLPICRKDMEERGWEQLDFVYVSGDAYVDHPSFGHAIITRLLEVWIIHLLDMRLLHVFWRRMDTKSA